MTNNTLPRLSLLTEEQIHQTHTYALRILAETGVRVDSPATREVLRQRFGLRADESARVRIPPEVVESAIGSAPKRIEVYDRRGRYAFTLGEDRLRFGAGVTALFYQCPEDDSLELFARRNMQEMTRLASALPFYDVVSTLGIVRDVPEHLSDFYGSLDMLANTVKPLVLLVSDESNFPPVLDMFESLAGDLGSKPFIIPYFNPVSPLGMNAGTTDKMQTAIARGLPIIFSNYSMAGVSTPLTPAGTLSLLLAELLAGLVISQAIKPGAQILLGMLPVYFDMKAVLNMYDPQSVLISLACAEMLAHYNIPHCSTSGSGTGWGMDLVAADTYWMNTLALSLTRSGLAPFIGDSHGSKSISPCTIVHAHEIIDQSIRFANGFQLDDANAALEEIQKVGAGGSFLTAPSTLKHYKSGYYVSRVYPRYTMEKWQEKGRPSADKVLREKTMELLATSPKPEDHDELMGKGEEMIRKVQNH